MKIFSKIFFEFILIFFKYILCLHFFIMDFDTFQIIFQKYIKYNIFIKISDLYLMIVLLWQKISNWLTFTRINPKKHITKIFDKNCISDVYRNKYLTFSDKRRILWCLTIIFFNIYDVFPLCLGISISSWHVISIWLPICNT